jgi:hypothetical protein
MAVLLRLTASSVITAGPTDVNWTVLKYPDVSSPRKLDAGSDRSYTPAREFSDAMSALLYNLDNVIPLRPEGPGSQGSGQLRNPEGEARREKKRRAHMAVWRLLSGKPIKRPRSRKAAVADSTPVSTMDRISFVILLFADFFHMGFLLAETNCGRTRFQK